MEAGQTCGTLWVGMRLRSYSVVSINIYLSDKPVAGPKRKFQIAAPVMWRPPDNFRTGYLKTWNLFCSQLAYSKLDNCPLFDSFGCLLLRSLPFALEKRFNKFDSYCFQLWSLKYPRFVNTMYRSKMFLITKHPITRCRAFWFQMARTGSLKALFSALQELSICVAFCPGGILGTTS
jgi:hypothetical protein